VQSLSPNARLTRAAVAEALAVGAAVNVTGAKVVMEGLADAGNTAVRLGLDVARTSVGACLTVS